MPLPRSHVTTSCKHRVSLLAASLGSDSRKPYDHHSQQHYVTSFSTLAQVPLPHKHRQSIHCSVTDIHHNTRAACRKHRSTDICSRSPWQCSYPHSRACSKGRPRHNTLLLRTSKNCRSIMSWLIAASVEALPWSLKHVSTNCYGHPSCHPNVLNRFPKSNSNFFPNIVMALCFFY